MYRKTRVVTTAVAAPETFTGVWDMELALVSGRVRSRRVGMGILSAHLHHCIERRRRG
jgi:hypothetical protein